MAPLKALFLTVLVVCSSTYVQAKRCYSCTGLTDMKGCFNIKQCQSEDMKCIAKGYRDGSVKKYDLDCSTATGCPNNDEVEVADADADADARAVINLWTSCCDDNYCNRLFDTNGNPEVRTDLHCYSCSGVADPVNCLQTTLCATGDACFTGQSLDTGGGESFNMQCLPIQTCELLGHHLPFGKRLTTCKACCDEGDNCNMEFCSRSLGKTNMTAIGTSAKPEVSTTIQPSTTSGYDNSVLKVTPTSATGIAGTSIDFNCTISPVPALSDMYLSWTFRKADETPLVIYNQTLVASFVTLTVKNLDETDAGTYTCAVHHPEKDWSATAHLIVRNALPIIKVPPKTQRIRNGYPCTLECVVGGNPTPTVQWSFLSPSGSTYIPSGTTINLDDSVYFNKTTVNHVGEWTCMASNVYGSMNASATITVY